MFNGLPVLSVVLVCVIVFSGCMALDLSGWPEGSQCQGILDHVKGEEPCVEDEETWLINGLYWCTQIRGGLKTLEEIEEVVLKRAC